MVAVLDGGVSAVFAVSVVVILVNVAGHKHTFDKLLSMVLLYAYFLVCKVKFYAK